MICDYFGISFVDGSAIPVFIVGSEGTREVGDVTSCNVWTAGASIPAFTEHLEATVRRHARGTIGRLSRSSRRKESAHACLATES